jgi:hypothetical protein
VRPSLTFLVLVSALAACSGNEAPPFLGLADDTYLRGVQVVPVLLDDGSPIARVELLVDGAPAAVATEAPFDLVWDTTLHPDGRHDLRARAIRVDGSQDDDRVRLFVDNAAPVIGDLPTTARRGAPYAIPVADNLSIARVEVVADGGAPVVLSPPYTIAWSWPCGLVNVTVRATDWAGGQTSRSVDVVGADSTDADCDGYAGVNVRGDDCNDADPAIHPGGFETGDAVDRNCDGITGAATARDADGDGVPSPAYGGDDCNDADATVHGGFVELQATPVVIDGVPLRWQPGEAAIDNSPWQLYLNRGGAIQVVTRPRSGEFAIAPVVTGANPGSIAARFGHVAFGRGNDVVVMRGSPGLAWVEETAIRGTERVGRLAFESQEPGYYAAFQAGTKVYFAERKSGLWFTQLLADAGAPLAGEIRLSAAGYGANVMFHTRSSAWTSSRSGDGGPLSTQEIHPGRSITATAQYSSLVRAVAVEHAGGGEVRDATNRSPLLRVGAPIIAMYAEWPYLFVQPATGAMQVVRADSGHRLAPAPAIGPIDATVHGYLAGDGVVYERTARSVRPADDASGDDVDADCDGRR